MTARSTMARRLMRGEWRLRRRRGSGIIVSAWMPCIVTSHPIVAAKQRSCYQLLLPKDENPEKPWAETGVPPVVRPGAAMRPHACGWMWNADRGVALAFHASARLWMDAIALRAYRHTIETVNRHLETMGSERLPRGANAGFERKAP
jgi:hypothetical protein